VGYTGDLEVGLEAGTRSERYVPAAGRRWLTAAYDPALALTMRERRFRRALVDEVLAGGHRRVLDLGCGTGSLAVALARRAPSASIIGLDGDPAVLQRAAGKARAARVRLELIEASADTIPLADGSVECVVSSLLLHHLSTDAKRGALAEARRVLSDDGRLLIADWGRPHDVLMRVAFLAIQLLDGASNTRAHLAGELPSLIEQAGFEVSVIDRLRTAWGSLELLAAAPTLAAPRAQARGS